MKVPTVLRIKAANQKNNRLELLKNIYGQKKSGRVWNKYLVKGLLKIGFEKYLGDAGKKPSYRVEGQGFILVPKAGFFVSDGSTTN